MMSTLLHKKHESSFLGDREIARQHTLQILNKSSQLAALLISTFLFF